MSITDILVEKGIIKKEDVPAITQEASAAKTSIEMALLKRGIDPERILEAKGEFFEVPTRKMEQFNIPSSILSLIPEDSARHYKFVPLAIVDNILEVGVIDPDDIDARDALNFIASKNRIPFKLFLIAESDFDKILELYHGISGEVNKALNELDTELKIEEEKDTASKKPKEGGPGGVSQTISEDAPVTKIVATVLRYATEGNASDIHIEPEPDSVKVRFRVDGVLHTSLVLPIKIHSAVVARIKIMCNMRLDEKRKPQDGRFSARIEGRSIDFRVSTFPTFYGEKVVMRLLDQQKGVKKLDDLGLSDRNLKLIRKAVARPYGLILISGPTGSGKTSTLYSILSELDREHQNVLSLEDPIEYNIPGMSQSQVRPEIGYDFADGLRTTLRQDPDIIMVGEIRDKETAQLAIQAALTGHLVFSTIHTNSAIGVVSRLVDMGVDPYLIAPTLILAMAQRLVSGLCPGTGTPIELEGGIDGLVEKQFADLPAEYRSEIPESKTVYEPEQTAQCPNGVKGRLAVMEVLEMDKEIEAVILKTPTDAEIWKIARAKGMLTMKEDAIIKAMRKEIPFNEVNTL